jgi:hypothetical protein
MSVRVMTFCLAVVFVAVTKDAIGQAGQSILLTASASAATNVGDGPRSGQCAPESKDRMLVEQLLLDFCNVDAIGSFLASARSSGNQSGNSLSASASMSAQAPLVDCTH